LAFELQLTIGRTSLRIGSPHGTQADPAPVAEEEQAAELREAFERAEEPSRADLAAEAVEATATQAEEVAGGIERANDLVTALAKGLTLDPRALEQQVNALLDLIDRADREGRFDDELRLARALVRLLVLVPRWIALVETLRRAASVAAVVGDRATEAWARHELGTFGLGAEDAHAANDLNEALRLREEIGDEAGSEVTRHNLRLLAARPVEPGQDSWLSTRLLVVGGAALTLLVLAGGLAVAAMVTGDDDDTPTLVEPTETAQTATEAGNQPPTVQDQTLDAQEDTETPWTAGASDPDGDALRCAIVREAERGLAAIEADCTGGRYTPTADYAGDDVFVYSVTDGASEPRRARVQVRVTPVNDPPVAGDDERTIQAQPFRRTSTTVTIDVADLLENDVDADDDPLTVTAVSPPETTVLEGETISYLVLPGAGPFTFTYTVADPTGATDEATVTVIVVAPPEPEPEPEPAPDPGID
jgi:Bacterial Ig domain